MNGVEGCYGGLPGNAFFSDDLEYRVPPDPSINPLGWSGVQVPNTGTTIPVVSTSAHDNFTQVHVNT